MAGSYNHVVTDDGNLGSNEFVVGMLENGGDVYEAVEEMYGMIWWLAGWLATGDNRAQEMREAVAQAERNYEAGLAMAREANQGA